MLIQYLIIILQILFILRFHIEIAGVPAFQEPVNTLRKITNPLVLPLKGFIPSPSMKKAAALVVAYVIALVGLVISAPAVYTIADKLLLSLLFFVKSWVIFLQYGLFVYVIGSWIQVQSLARINYLLHQIFQPVLNPIRAILPSFGGLDLSPMVLLLGLSFVSNWFFGLFQ